ncbi:hypothetical protein GCK72_026270 [Caenorhabditis remanei]|uniref:PAZ domain-containing protein n=1 Tax=Caenorhabditis remanei TaxID=31234 RepID=A0A6A5G4Z0_CAERE|nr:hypothetical protein GCK72_026270 [Caenorhabditis remanei]KAF1749801.1 hypothetical protein GCK72_026270 [Caenorhabditis remanei]
MTRFRTPRPPYWLTPPCRPEMDFYLKDYMRYRGDFVENLSPYVTEKYTKFLNQPQVLHIWNTITYTTIHLPIIVPEYYTTSTRMPTTTKTVEEIYKEDYAYTINYPYSPIISDVLGRYHPIEVCAVRITSCV